MGGEGGRNGGRKGGGESAAIRSRIRWCSTRWRLGVYHGARRGEVAGAVHIDSRDEGRVEDRNDFGVISSTAEPVRDREAGVGRVIACGHRMVVGPRGVRVVFPRAVSPGDERGMGGSAGSGGVCAGVVCGEVARVVGGACTFVSPVCKRWGCDFGCEPRGGGLGCGLGVI